MELDNLRINKKGQNPKCEGVKSEKLIVNGTERARLLPQQIKNSHLMV